MSENKKRKTSRQLTKDDADEEDETVEAGVFKKAPEEVLKQRKIVKVKRRGTTSTPKPEVEEEKKEEKKDDSTPKISWNFLSTEKKTEEKKEETNGKIEEKTEEKKEEEKKEEKVTGFNFNFTPVSTEPEVKKEEKNESPAKFNFNFSDTPSFSFNTNSDAPTFSFGNEKFDFQGFSGVSNSESSFSFSTVGGDDDKKEKKEEASLEWKEEYTPEPIQETSKPIIDLPEEPVKTGEEEDKNIFQSRVKLYEYITKDEKSEWLERGVGVIKLNQMPSKTDYRLIMRTEATHRLILNFKLFPDLKASSQSDKKVTVNGINDIGKPTTYLIRFSKVEAAEDFIKNVEKSTPSK